jgi:hypothetical protein
MKKDDLGIIDKKTIEALIEELQYLNSDILPKLAKGSELYSNISSIDIKVKDSSQEISKVSKLLFKLYKNVNYTIDNIAKRIDVKPIEDKILEMVTFDGGRLRNMIDKMHRELVIALRDTMMTVEDFEEQKRDIISLKKYLNYLIYSNSFLFVAIALLIYKI